MQKFVLAVYRTSPKRRHSTSRL